MRKDLMSIQRAMQDIDDFTIAGLGSDFKEQVRIWDIEKAIRLAKKNLELKKEIINLSMTNHEFLKKLKEVLDRLGF